jgi:chemotaxis protein CheX
MNVNFLNPFVTAARDVLKMETGVTVDRGDLKLDLNPHFSEEVTVVIALIGCVEGVVFYSMRESMALQLVSRMMGEKMQSLDHLAQSGIAEIGNVITGRAATRLAETGFEANISPPSLVMGKDATLSTMGLPRLIVPLETECGTLTIHLALRENRNSKRAAGELPTPATPEM